MISKTPPIASKKNTIRFPNRSELGHGLQGCGIGVVIGQMLSVVHMSPVNVSVIFFCFVAVGGFIVSSSKR